MKTETGSPNVDLIIFFIVLTLSVAFAVYVFFRRARRVQKIVPPAPHEEPQPIRTALPRMAQRLELLGFTVHIHEPWSPLVPVLRTDYAICMGTRREYPCTSCGARNVHPLGETRSIDYQEENWLSWFAMACDACGRIDRFSADTAGFLGRMLDHGASLFEVIIALESHAKWPIFIMMERVLAERECILRMKADSAATLRHDLLKKTGGATSVLDGKNGKNVFEA